MKEHEKLILEKMRAYAVQAIQFKGDIEFAVREGSVVSTRSFT